MDSRYYETDGRQMMQSGDRSGKTVLFLSYNGLLEPLLSSQAIPYMRSVARKGYRFILLTYEKPADLKRTDPLALERMRRDLAAEGIEWHYYRYHKYPRMIATLFDLFRGSIFCLFTIPLRRVKIVHARGVTPGSIMLFVPRFFRCKLLFDMRGRLAEEMAAGGLWRSEGTMFRLIKKAEAALLAKADAVTVLTKRHFEYNRMLPVLKTRPVMMETIPCCVDTDAFRPDDALRSSTRRELGLRDEFVLCYPGKLGTFYFVDGMLDFFLTLLSVRPESLFLIVTPDDPDIALQKAFSRGIAPDRIKIVSRAGFAAMPGYMRAADAGIFFINSRDKLGSSPVKFGEFLASGVPVIINPGVGDTEDVVRTKGVGVVVEEFDKDHYVKAVAELDALRSDMPALRARCRDAASGDLSLSSGSARYFEIYERMLGGL